MSVLYVGKSVKFTEESLLENLERAAFCAEVTMPGENIRELLLLALDGVRSKQTIQSLRQGLRDSLFGYTRDMEKEELAHSKIEAHLRAKLNRSAESWAQIVEVDGHRVIGVSKTGAVKLCNHWLNIARSALEDLRKP